MAKPEGENAEARRSRGEAERGLDANKEGTVPLASPLVSAPGGPARRAGSPGRAVDANAEAEGEYAKAGGRYAEVQRGAEVAEF